MKVSLRKSSKIIIIFFTSLIIFGLLLSWQVQAMVCSCHVHSDTSPTGLANKAANIASKIENAATAGATAGILATQLWNQARIIVVEALKDALINYMTNEIVAFLQGKIGDKAPKFVTDLTGYIFGVRNFYQLGGLIANRLDKSLSPITRRAVGQALSLKAKENEPNVPPDWYAPPDEQGTSPSTWQYKPGPYWGESNQGNGNQREKPSSFQQNSSQAGTNIYEYQPGPYWGNSDNSCVNISCYNFSKEECQAHSDCCEINDFDWGPDCLPKNSGNSSWNNLSQREKMMASAQNLVGSYKYSSNIPASPNDSFSNSPNFNFNWNAFFDSIVNPIAYNPNLAVIEALDRYDQEKSIIEQEQILKYLASQGFAPQTAQSKTCEVKDKNGNCLKYKEEIVTPGIVFKSLLSSAADAHVKRIVNAQTLLQILKVVANSLADKLVKAGGRGLLGASHKTESFPSVQAGRVLGSINQSGGMDSAAWFAYKYQSVSLLEGQLLSVLGSLEKCYSEKGSSYLADEVERIKSDYNSQLDQINQEIKEKEQSFQVNLSDIQKAKSQYQEISDALSKYKNLLIDCENRQKGEKMEVEVWIDAKENSLSLINNQIIPTLDKLKGSANKCNLSLSDLEAKENAYSQKAQEISSQLDQVKSSPLSYDPSVYSSGEKAEAEYQSLSSELNRLKNQLYNCTNPYGGEYIW